MRTSAEGSHASGDVIGGYLLAHAASHEGMTAAEDIAGQRVAPMDQTLVTRCTYSHPQIASVGLTEKQARDAGREVKVGKFPFTALGRAIIHGETAGFVKLVADAKSGSLIGAHVVGPSATELIAEPALTQLFQGDAWELGRNIHPHPTLSEAALIGVSWPLKPKHDWLAPYYRDVVLCMRMGMTPLDLMLAVLAKPADPASGGKQTPGHFSDSRLNITSGGSPVAAQMVRGAG